MDADRCARLLEDRRADRRVLIGAPASGGRQPDDGQRHDEASSSTRSPRSPRPAAWRTSCASPTDIPAEEGVVDRRRGAQQQVHLQHARADQRPHGQGRQGRHRRRRARPPQGAVRLLRPRARVASSPATSSRCSTSAACWASAIRPTPDKGKPFDCRVLGVVLQFPYLGERIGVPARVGYRRARSRRRRSTRAACRWSRSPAPAWRPARPPRPARSSPHAPSRPHRRCLQGHRRLAAARHPGDGGRRRAPHDDLHRSGRRRPPRAHRPGADAHHADRAGRRQARCRSCSSSATACSAPTASMRFSSAPTSAARSPAWCCRPTIRSRPGAA